MALILALFLPIPSHQAAAASPWNGVETRGRAPHSEGKGESIVQTTNRKGGESRSGNSLKVLDEQVWLYQLAEKYPLPEGNGTQMDSSAAWATA